MKKTTELKTTTGATTVLSRRSFVQGLAAAIPALATVPKLFAQGSSNAIELLKLHNFGLRVTDVERSVAFYQGLFGMPVQSRLGETVCLRIGDGPRFFSISPTRAGEQPGFSHIGLSLPNFSLEAVRSQLDDHGFSRGEGLTPGQSRLEVAMTSWVETQENNSELFMADQEGLVLQLSAEDYCGNGSNCGVLESAPATGKLQLGDINHFTNFLTSAERANQFYLNLFGLQFQAYQGPSSPIVGIGDGFQFLMFIGGGASSVRPSNPARTDHVSMSVADFSVDGILGVLSEYGLTARIDAANTQPLEHWVSMRMPNRGGVEGGTPEVYFSDPDGIRIQLQDASYCGGGDYLGDRCEALV
ncbi:MAG: hypothetical protein COC19_00180 [SAR86 cluster bacterium]|uniref:VOC domain-containing protein n=1 Tax=SAR86 cluster bacterium TaxID=2030880 RepID=A0A2A4MW31_9GAMM|nr:MAG: hypothetical protein COC19_00180 [SAR86 cluster bacterium]